MSTKRILVLNYEFPPLGGGASPVSYEIAKNLSEMEDYIVDVVTMNFKKLSPHEVISPHFNIYRVKSFRRRKEICQPWEQFTYLVSAYFKVNQLLKKHHYDVVHCHFIVPTGVLALILKIKHSLPYVISVHGSDVPGFNPDRFVLLHKFIKPLLRMICDNSEKIVALSSYLKELIIKNIKNYGEEKLIVIPNGIDIKKFKPLKKEKIILSTGRLLPRKGFQHLIEAFSKEDLGYEIHIVGDGPMMKKLLEMAKNSKTKVFFHGWVSNDSKKYRYLLGKASIYCLVSKRENASIALLEAMSSGCAVITANDSGCAETVENSGVLVPFGNIKILNEKIKDLIGNSKKMKNMQEAAKTRVKNIYNWSAITKSYAIILE